jgi:hypothetical protein
MIIGMGQKMHVSYATLLDKVGVDGVAKPSYYQRVKENAWIRNMDTKDGQWDIMDVFYNFRNDSGGEAYGLYNWKDPYNYKLTKTGTVTYTSMDGCNGNGTTGRYSTAPWSPNTGPNAAHGNMSFSLDRLSVGGGGQLAACNRSGQDYVSFSGAIAKIAETNGSAGITATSGGTGHWICQKNSINSNSLYKDGALDAGPTACTDESRPTTTLTIFARNNNGTVTDFCSNKIGYFQFGQRITNPAAFHASLQIFKS